MAIILEANKVNLFVSSVFFFFVFWYHSPKFLDTPHICHISRLRTKRNNLTQRVQQRHVWGDWRKWKILSAGTVLNWGLWVCEAGWRPKQSRRSAIKDSIESDKLWRLTIGCGPLESTAQLLRCVKYLNKHVVCEMPYIGPCKYTSLSAVQVRYLLIRVCLIQVQLDAHYILYFFLDNVSSTCFGCYQDVRNHKHQICGIYCFKIGEA
jgi:hypothetical protein